MNFRRPYDPPNELPEQKREGQEKTYWRLSRILGAIWIVTWGIAQFFGNVEIVSGFIPFKAHDDMLARLYINLVTGITLYMAYDSQERNFNILTALASVQMLGSAYAADRPLVWALVLAGLSLLTSIAATLQRGR